MHAKLDECVSRVEGALTYRRSAASDLRVKVHCCRLDSVHKPTTIETNISSQPVPSCLSVCYLYIWIQHERTFQ
jgi:hypothetical protein